ncbi:alpha/beta fold hydrolase [Erwinia sp. CPCC 100877]|nr:alpha/beta fold hydrolase [Erwinia sp. CPCC 100877]
MKINISGIELNYFIYGKGQPIVCIHGFGVDHRLMSGCLEPIFEKSAGYQRIYVDLPGMGQSTSKESLCADEMIKILQAFLRQVIGTASYSLIGESYGGYLSLGLAKQETNRISGLYLLCPCTISRQTDRILPVRKIPIVSEKIEVSVAQTNDYHDFLQVATIATKATWQSYQKDILPGIKQADQAFLNRYQANGYSFSCEKELEAFSLDAPVTIITGKQDDVVGYVDAFRFMKQFSRASFLVVDDAGHNLQIEQPMIFQHSFNAWLEKITE